LDSIIAALTREELRDFGVFEVRVVKARKARNPKTGAQVMVPERRRGTFEPRKRMEERVEDSAKSVEANAAAPLAAGSE
jgi:nucleoid DNA-binding protein